MNKDLYNFLAAEYVQKIQIERYLKWDKEKNWNPIKEEIIKNTDISKTSNARLTDEENTLNYRKIKIDSELKNKKSNNNPTALKWASLSNKLLIKNNTSEKKSNNSVISGGTKLTLNRIVEEQRIEQGACFALSCKWLKNFNHSHTDNKDVAISNAKARMSRLYFPVNGETDGLSSGELAAKIAEFTNTVETQRWSYAAFLDLVINNKAKAGTPESHLGLMRDILISHKMDFTEHYIKNFDPKNFKIPYKPAPPFNTVVNDLDAIDGSFMLLLQFNKNSGGSAHATCGNQKIQSHFILKTGTLFFFDPNFGEFFVRRSERKEFFNALGKNYAMIGQNIHGYHVVPLNRIP